MIKKGDLVKHISDNHCNKFGLGLVTNVIQSNEKKSIARVVWQEPPVNVMYPADLFTFEGLVVVSKANENDTVFGDRNCEREYHRK